MKQEMSVLGIDIAKRVFHAVGRDETGKIVFCKRLSQHDLMPFIAELPPALIGLEACGGSALLSITPPSTKSLPGGPMTAHSSTPPLPVSRIYGTTISLISAFCTATAPTQWPKRAVMALATAAINTTRRVKKASPSLTTTVMCSHRFW